MFCSSFRIHFRFRIRLGIMGKEFMLEFKALFGEQGDGIRQMHGVNRQTALPEKLLLGVSLVLESRDGDKLRCRPVYCRYVQQHNFSFLLPP